MQPKFNLKQVSCEMNDKKSLIVIQKKITYRINMVKKKTF